jgi:hypothetical protein
MATVALVVALVALGAVLALALFVLDRQRVTEVTWVEDDLDGDPDRPA